MASIPIEDADRPTMAPIKPADLVYKLALDSALQRHADRISGVNIREAKQTKYVTLEMQVLDSRPGLPTFGADTITIEMPEEYMPGYNPNNN